MTKPLFSLATAILLSTPLGAQILPSAPDGDAAAWAALLGTPSGALVPVMTRTMTGLPTRSAQVVFRYGYMSGENDLATLHNFAVTALLPAGTGATFSLTAGMVHPACVGCDNHLMLSAGGDMGLYSSPLGPSSDAGRITVSLSGELGYGKPQDESLIAGTVGLPFALVLGTGAMKFVPYVTPAFGFGRASANGSAESGTRFLLGGGIGLHNPESSVSVHGGFQQIFITDAKMLFGIGLSVGGR